MEEGDAIFCTVKKIEGTTVFLETDLGFPATMVLSEVAAGRIRNLRSYVSPNKKIVCKVLKISRDHLELSLRRVTAKEREEVLEKSQKERTFKSMLNAAVKTPEEIIQKIQKDYSLSAFLDEIRENPEIAKKYLDNEEAISLIKIVNEKREKEKSVTKVVTIKSQLNIKDTKEILKTNDAEVRYLGSSKFSIKKLAPDFKEAERLLRIIVEEMSRKAKERQALFEIKEKK